MYDLPSSIQYSYLYLGNRSGDALLNVQSPFQNTVYFSGNRSGDALINVQSPL